MRIVVKLIGDKGELVLDNVKRWEWAACAYFVEVTGTGERWRFRADRVEWVQVVKEGTGDKSESSRVAEEPYKFPADYCFKHGYHSKCGPCDTSHRAVPK